MGNAPKLNDGNIQVEGGDFGQCRAYEQKDGNRCKNDAVDIYGYCTQHIGHTSASPEIYERRATVMELRKRGLSYDRIAEHVGVSRNTVRKDVIRCLKQLNALAVERAHELIHLDLERLDEMQERYWEATLEGNKQAHKQTMDVMRHRARLVNDFLTKKGPKNQLNIQINNNAPSVGAVQLDEVGSTPGGMLTPSQIRKFDDPEQAAKLEARIVDLELKRIEWKRKGGELISRKEIWNELHSIFRVLRDRALSVPARVSSELAAMGESADVRRCLDEELRQLLNDVADAVERSQVIPDDPEETGEVVDAEFVESG